MDQASPSPTPEESAGLDSEFQAQLGLFQKLGFSQAQVRAVLLKLGLNTDTNSLLGELIQAGVETEDKDVPVVPALVSRGDGSSSKTHSCVSLSTEQEETAEDDDALRPIVIDGSNVAMR